MIIVDFGVRTTANSVIIEDDKAANAKTVPISVIQSKRLIPFHLIHHSVQTTGTGNIWCGLDRGSFNLSDSYSTKQARQLKQGCAPRRPWTDHMIEAVCGVQGCRHGRGREWASGRKLNR